MGVKKKYQEERVSVNFKTSKDKRERFMKIVNQRLLTKGNFVMNRMLDDFLEDWEDQEKKVKLFKKYFKLEI